MYKKYIYGLRVKSGVAIVFQSIEGRAVLWQVFLNWSAHMAITKYAAWPLTDWLFVERSRIPATRLRVEHTHRERFVEIGLSKLFTLDLCRVRYLVYIRQLLTASDEYDNESVGKVGYLQNCFCSYCFIIKM